MCIIIIIIVVEMVADGDHVPQKESGRMTGTDWTLLVASSSLASLLTDNNNNSSGILSLKVRQSPSQSVPLIDRLQREMELRTRL